MLMEKLSLISLLVVIFHSVGTLFVCYGDISLVNCPANDREALVDFKNGLKDPEDRLSSWRGSNCCLWRGIGCDNNTGNVIKIDLHNPYPVSSHRGPRFWNLSGEIRPSLLKLKSLRYLDLSLNAFGGVPIPEFFGSLKRLQYLNLSYAEFSGKIPPTLGNLSSLQYLDVSCESPSLTIDNFRWVTSLVSLKHLQMNQVNLSLVESKWLEMINLLPDLTELHLSNCMLSGPISSLDFVNFTSLAVVDLSLNSFQSMFPDWLVNISSLTYVDLSSCNLRGRIPLGLAELPSLRYLDLAQNTDLTASCLELFTRSWKAIEVLNLADNKLYGELPASIGNMTFLSRFDLSSNNVEGELPSTIGGLCNLVYLDLSQNQLTGSLPEVLKGTENCVSKSYLPGLKHLGLGDNRLVGKLPVWLAQLRNLEQLDLSANLFDGPIPAALWTFESLTELNLAGNQLNGSVPESLGELSELWFLDVSSNHLSGIITEAHFANLSKLEFLFFGSNAFIFNVSYKWSPPFLVYNLDLRSCQLGPSFPAWLESQKTLGYLDISNANISDFIPNWFWNITSYVVRLNISFNQLQGQLKTPFQVSIYSDVDFSFNLFNGSIPLPSSPIRSFVLSGNKFQGPIPQKITEAQPFLLFLSLSDNQLTGEIPASIGKLSGLLVLDLSRNNLTGSIPSSIGNCSYLKVLDLGNNSLSGVVPYSFGQLNQLQSLHLNDNMLSGELPSSFRNLSSLETLDLGRNSISGDLPLWLVESFPSLGILNLRSNALSGGLPQRISNLSKLQVLDLAKNNLTGQIPASLGDLQAMAQEHKIKKNLMYGNNYYEERLVVHLNNETLTYTKTLSLLTALDLSDNNFHGEFPMEVLELSGLVKLNFARNQIGGQIPQNISSLRQLASLDLSSNKLTGVIPPIMASLSFLSYLNLSNNNLSGMIPYTSQMSTFTQSAFEGNPGLCGDPLPVKCQSGVPETNKVEKNSDDERADTWFYLSVGLGFLVGVLAPYLILATKRSWSGKYFYFVDYIVCYLYSHSRLLIKKPRSTR